MMRNMKRACRLLFAALFVLLAFSVTAGADYTLKFNANGGTFIDPDTGEDIGEEWTYRVAGLDISTQEEDILGLADLWQYTAAGTSVMKDGAGLKRDGYMIAGWYTDPACKHKAFSDHTAYYFRKFKFYAKWVPATDAYTWKVTFDMNGEVFYPNSDLSRGISKVTYRVAKGEPILDQRDRVLRYTTKSAEFRYWSYDKAGTKPVNAPGAIVPKGNMTFYAQYKSSSGASSLALTEKNVTMKAGQTHALTLANPNVLRNMRLYWYSSNPSAVWVDQNGVLTAFETDGTGEKIAEITVKKYGEMTPSATCIVKVPATAEYVSVNNLQTNGINAKQYVKKIGAKVTLKAESPDEGRAFDYWSFNESVKFTDGTYGKSNSKKKVSFYMPAKPLVVTAVDKPLKLKGISLSKKSLQLGPGQTYELVPKMKPAGAPYQTMVWFSTNGNVAEVSSEGIVTAKGGGTCKISVTVNDRYKAVCTVKVKTVKAKKAVFQKSKLTLKKGKSFKLKLKVKPAGAQYYDIVWGSDNGNVASVTAKGVIKTRGKGKCTIYCSVKTTGGKKLKAKCRLTVK